MDVEEKVVIRLLESLGDGVKLALVRTRIICLCLAGDRADEVGMDAHCETHHVYGFDDVRRPVAALFVCFNLVDDHIVLLLAVR